ncbi:MAG: LysM peptidoglycan-binding domain-containing protein [Verrucomicrobia bacterium]|nr:LysM peptidoglycan-binding domain-containing protein [Verrucomicrobiota bacterium]
MWKYLLLGLGLALAARGQNQNVEIANLREDVRGLSQRVGELLLRVEQLERENAELRRRSAVGDKSYATLAQVQQSLGDLGRELRAAIATSKTETLQQVAAQLEKMGKQTNAALEALSRSSPPRTGGGGGFSEDFPKEGVSYTVQKGDTLAVIARKTGAKQQDIINANRLADPSRITVGQTLFIPGGK